VTMTVKAAPRDLVLDATIGGPAARIKVARPRQTAVVRFTAKAGQKVVGHWTGPDITGSVNLHLYDPRHEELESWTGSDDDTSDVVVLADAGTYTVEATWDDEETGDGQLAIERR
jgi:hypothetical protein